MPPSIVYTCHYLKSLSEAFSCRWQTHSAEENDAKLAGYLTVSVFALCFHSAQEVFAFRIENDIRMNTFFINFSLNIFKLII